MTFRKLIAILLSALLLITLPAGCTTPEETTAPETTAPETTAEETEAEIPLEEHAPGTVKTVSVYRKNAETDETAELMVFEDLPEIPYICIEDFYHLFFPEKALTVQRKGDVFTITNPEGYSAVIDAAEETLRAEDLMEFTNLMGILQEDMKNGYYDGQPYARVKSVEYDKASPIDLDFGKYGIDLRQEGGKLYFPVVTLSDLYTDAAYNYVTLTGDRLWVQDLFNNNPDEYPQFSVEVLRGNRDEKTAEYSYNELCFAIDLGFGVPGRTRLDPYFEKGMGLDEALDAYGPMGKDVKKLLKSTDWMEYLIGVVGLDALLYDGGHTSMQSIIIPLEAYLSDEPELYARFQNIMGQHMDIAIAYAKALDETIMKLLGFSIREQLREQMYHGATYVKKGDTAVCVLDSFLNENMSKVWEGVYGEKDENGDPKLPSGEQAFDDPVLIVYDALEKAAADPEIKNFVVDISNNGGGSLDVLAAILCLFTGKTEATMHFKNRLTDQCITEVYEIDRNFDGVIDEKDLEKQYSFNFAILTSSFSFSCANIMAAVAKEAGFMVLGEQSGGGACTVQCNSTLEGLNYQMSSGIGIFYDENFENNIDGGIPADGDLIEDKTMMIKSPYSLSTVQPDEDGQYIVEIPDYTDFYNIDLLSREIHAFYEAEAEAAD